MSCERSLGHLNHTGWRGRALVICSSHLLHFCIGPDNEEGACYRRRCAGYAPDETRAWRVEIFERELRNPVKKDKTTTKLKVYDYSIFPLYFLLYALLPVCSLWCYCLLPLGLIGALVSLYICMEFLPTFLTLLSSIHPTSTPFQYHTRT